MIRKISLTAVLLFVMFLCGCSSQQETVTYATWGSATEIEITKNIIKDFETENPGIKIQLIHIPQNYFPKIHLLFASNTAPDVVFINNLNLPIYEKFLEDLSESVNINEFYSQAVESLSRNGKLLAIPRDLSYLVYYVNTDISKIPPQNAKIEDYLKIWQETSNNGNFGVSYEKDSYFLLPYVNYFGGEFINKNGEVSFSTKESKEGLEFYTNLVKKYNVAPAKNQVGSFTTAQMFLNGKIGYYLSGRWMYPKISETANFNWQIVLFPNGKNQLPCDSSGWAVSKNSKHKESAIKFVQYISSERSSDYYAETGLIIPARIKTANKLISGKHNEKAFIDVIENSKSTNVNKNYKRITDRINLNLDL